MEEVYKKVVKGKKVKYVPCGYEGHYSLPNGIWLVQSGNNCSSMKSLVWKVGDLKRPVDIVTHASLQTMSDRLANYLVKLSDSQSEEYKDALKLCGGYLNTPVVYNITPMDLVSLFIREIAKGLENQEIKK